MDGASHGPVGSFEAARDAARQARGLSTGGAQEDEGGELGGQVAGRVAGDVADVARGLVLASHRRDAGKGVPQEGRRIGVRLARLRAHRPHRDVQLICQAQTVFE